MGPVRVVLIDVVDDEAFELALVPDDRATEELAAQGRAPSFREGVGHRSTDWWLDYLQAFGSEDLIERVDRLAAAVAHQSTGVLESLAVAHEKVAGCLSGPRAGSDWP